MKEMLNVFANGCRCRLELPIPLPRAYGIPRPSVDQRLAGLAEQTLCEE